MEEYDIAKQVKFVTRASRATMQCCARAPGENYFTMRLLSADMSKLAHCLSEDCCRPRDQQSCPTRETRQYTYVRRPLVKFQVRNELVHVSSRDLQLHFLPTNIFVTTNMVQPHPENDQQGHEVGQKCFGVRFQVLGVFPTPGRPAVARSSPPSSFTLLTGGNTFQGVANRDLKLENLLFDQQGGKRPLLMIANFGYSSAKTGVILGDNNFNAKVALCWIATSFSSLLSVLLLL